HSHPSFSHQTEAIPSLPFADDQAPSISVALGDALPKIVYRSLIQPCQDWHVSQPRAHYPNLANSNLKNQRIIPVPQILHPLMRFTHANRWCQRRDLNPRPKENRLHGCPVPFWERTVLAVTGVGEMQPKNRSRFRHTVRYY